MKPSHLIAFLTEVVWVLNRLQLARTVTDDVLGSFGEEGRGPSQTGEPSADDCSTGTSVSVTLLLDGTSILPTTILDLNEHQEMVGWAWGAEAVRGCWAAEAVRG